MTILMKQRTCFIVLIHVCTSKSPKDGIWLVNFWPWIRIKHHVHGRACFCFSTSSLRSDLSLHFQHWTKENSPCSKMLSWRGLWIMLFELLIILSSTLYITDYSWQICMGVWLHIKTIIEGMRVEKKFISLSITNEALLLLCLGGHFGEGVQLTFWSTVEKDTNNEGEYITIRVSMAYFPTSLHALQGCVPSLWPT